MSRLRFVLPVAVLAMFDAGAIPASAMSSVHADFVVRVRTTGLNIPVFQPPDRSDIQITATVACAVSEGSPKKSPLVSSGLCLLTGTGWLLGVCYDARGEFAGTLSSSGNTFPYSGQLVIEGSSFTVTGTAAKGVQTGPMVIHGQMIEEPTDSPPCGNEFDNSWTLAGTFDATVL